MQVITISPQLELFHHFHNWQKKGKQRLSNCMYLLKECIFLLVGGFKHFLFSISYMGCHPKPIDELHHFSGWLVYHQPGHY
jgi:hypothetical protein